MTQVYAGTTFVSSRKTLVQRSGTLYNQTPRGYSLAMTVWYAEYLEYQQSGLVQISLSLFRAYLRAAALLSSSSSAGELEMMTAAVQATSRGATKNDGPRMGMSLIC